MQTVPATPDANPGALGNLFKLPVEIRSMIYEEVIASEKKKLGVHLCSRLGTTSVLMKIGRMMRQEVRPLFYRRMIYYFQFDLSVRLDGLLFQRAWAAIPPVSKVQVLGIVFTFQAVDAPTPTLIGISSVLRAADSVSWLRHARFVAKEQPSLSIGPKLPSLSPQFSTFFACEVPADVQIGGHSGLSDSAQSAYDLWIFSHLRGHHRYVAIPWTIVEYTLYLRVRDAARARRLAMNAVQPPQPPLLPDYCLAIGMAWETTCDRP